jgi:cyclase
MIDTPIFPTDALKWRAEINKKGKLQYIINTEPHADHSRNSYFFDGVPVTHQATRNILATVSSEEVMKFVKHNDPDGLPLMEGYKVRLAEIAFEGNLTLYLGHHTFRLIHLPGHTAGQIGVYIPEERVVFTADCVVYHCKSWLHEAMPHRWIESLQTLSELDIDTVIPGHGAGVATCKKEYIKEQALIIKKWIEVVESAIIQGLSKEEASTQIVCPDPYPIVGLSSMSETDLNKAIIARLYHVLTSGNVAHELDSG